MENQIEDYLQMDDDSIYKSIGEAAIENQGLQGIESFKDKIKLGLNIFNEYKEKFRNLICKNKSIVKVLQSEELNTSVNVASLIISLISPLVISGTATLIAVLLVRYGILKYCEIV